MTIKIKRNTFESNAKECIEIIKKYNIKYISFWENSFLEIVFHPTKDDVLTFEINNSKINDWSRSLFIYSEDLTKIAKEFNLPNPIIVPSMYSVNGSEVIHSNPLNSEEEFKEMKMEIKIENYNNEVVNMKQNIRRAIQMYIKLHKACDTNVEECDDIQNTIVNVIEENLKYYGIDKYDYKNEGGTTTEAFEYYVEEMVKKYYNIPNWFETEYGKRCIYIPHDLENITKIKNTLNNIKTKDQIINFLDWYKETETTGLSCQFNYRIITKNEISKVIQTYEHTEIRIDLQDFGYGLYNPIICWLNTKDTPTLMIMDWVCLKNEIDHWISYNGDSESFIEKFKTPTLEDEIKEKYPKLHPEVRKALLKEIIEFWDEFKDDIRVEDDTLESISHNMMLVDAIWNYAPLFCNNTIEGWIEKIYNKEVRI